MAGSEDLPVVAFFPDRAHAETAIDELWHAGFHKDHIGMASPGERVHQATTATEGIEERAADGAEVGAIAGGAVGAAAGTLVALTVPGLGPVLAAGLFLGFGGAAAGAALGTFAGPFLAMGLSRKHAQRYEAEIRAGRTIVVVRTPDRKEEAVAILHSHGAVDVEVNGGPITQSV